MNFKTTDVVVPTVPGMFTTFLIKNKPYFVDLDSFKDIDHYGRLMGYDKPIENYIDEIYKKGK